MDYMASLTPYFIYFKLYVTQWDWALYGVLIGVALNVVIKYFMILVTTKYCMLPVID